MSDHQSQDEYSKKTLHTIEGIVRDFFRDDSIIINTDTSAKDIEGWDSLAHISLIVAIEKKFGIKFKLAELHDIRTIGDILSIITTKMGK